MKKVLLLAALVFASLQLTAANVNLTTAQQSAQRFLMNKTVNGRFMASAPAIKWTHEVKNSSDASLAAYYIVNSDNGYVIVAGDDRAKTILAYGDTPLKSVNDLPDAVQYFLDIYQKQMEYLQAHPGLVVQQRANTRAVSVEPLLKTAWGQNGPYNRKCPRVGRDYCMVGCSAVSLAQVMKYWEYPAGSPALPGYKGEEFGITVDALPEYTFDWENQRDTYEGMSSSAIDQMSETDLNAIAMYMRYVGQAEMMDYGTQKSGAGHEQILQAIQTFGYDPGARIEMKWDYDDGTVNYTEEAWCELIQSELRAGRPLVYCAFDTSGSGESFGIAGHSFNVDGYDAENDLYHVNFGMNSSANTYYAIDAFAYDYVTIYDFYPLLFAGVQPPGLSTDPRIFATPNTLNMEAYAGENTTATFNVTGDHLTGDITLTLNDENGVFAIDATTVALGESKTITVTYAPQAEGTHNATITLSSAGANDVVVTLKGTATAAPLVVYDPVMLPAVEQYINLTSFRADWTDQTAANDVVSYTLDVKEKASAGGLLAEVDWSTAVGDGDDDLPEGWTRGDYSIFVDEGGMAITTDSYIRTNALDLSAGKVTVVVKAKGYYPWSYMPSELTVKTSVDAQTVTLTTSYTDYTFVLNCADNDQVEFFATANNPTIQTIKIYAGEVTAPQLRATVEGDASHYIISGITEKNYTVNNLNAGGTYLFKVKALYTDGTESAWSNVETVTLVENTPTYIRGDVNGDKNITITDVTALINYLLSNDATGINLQAADCDLDSFIKINDVTTLINYLLNNNNW